MSDTRNAGIALMVFSALLWSTVGLFTKSVDASAWNIVFWRGAFAALLTSTFVVMRGQVRREFLQLGKWGWAAAVIGASGTAAFIPAFKLTSVSNVAMIYASAPVVAGLLAWGWMAEKPSKAVVFGIVLSVLGMGFIVGGSLGGGGLQGDLLALWMTIAIALLMVIYRRFPALASAGPAVLSSVILLPFAFVLGDPLSVSPHEIGILACFGLVFAIAPVTMAEGAKRLPSGETALLSALESPLAVVLAFVILAEVPAHMTLIGGSLILVAVVSSQLFQKRNDKW